jgi:signal transduction histidine kinase
MAQALRLTRQALDAGDLPRVEHMLTLVTQQAESSAELVNALLTLARAGSVALQPGPVDLGTVVAESLAQLRGPGATTRPRCQ